MTAETPRMSGGQAVARTLERHGVRHVFGIPGVHTIELYRGLAGTGIQHVTPRHEQGAAFMADGYARASGGPGVAFVITGPGLANAATPIATAYSDSVPLLVVTAQIERPWLATGRRLSHELLDQMQFVSGLTSSSHRPGSAQAAANAIRDAFTAFCDRRPIPTVVEVPVDVLAEVGSAVIPEPRRVALSLPSGSDLERALQWLTESVAPVIIVGGGAQGAAGPVLDLVARLGGPVFSSSSGKGVVPDDHPQFVATGLNFETTKAAILGADLVILIGTEFGSMDTYSMTTMSWPMPPHTIQIDIDPGQIGRNLPANLGLVGDSAAIVSWLVGHLPREAAVDAGRIRAIRRRIRSEISAMSGSLTPWVQALQAALPNQTILAADITRPVTYSAIHLWQCYEPRSWLRPLGLTTLGYALPAAIGAKVARPDRPVAALIGDGGLMFTVGEFIVASELELNLPIVVWNDHSYGEIRNKMEALDIPPIGTALRSPDLPSLAASLGGAGCSVRTPEALGREVRLALERDHPTLIEVVAP